MTTQSPSEVTAAEMPPEHLHGQPQGLYMLFFAELWERFCYYGMRALLTLYLVNELAQPQAHASMVYGVFTSLIYSMGTFGGLIADRVLGYRRAILLGGALMAVGEYALVVPGEQWFYYGLAFLIVGNGLFKPNVSTMVGKLYAPGDPRRDGGFTIFYMGINIGALAAPIVCAYIAEATGSRRWGFFAAGIGMLLGLVTFYLGRWRIGELGEPPKTRWSPLANLLAVAVGALAVVQLAVLLITNQKWTEYLLIAVGVVLLTYLMYLAFFRSDRAQRDRFFALVILLAGNVVFWAFFEQAGNAVNLFTDQNVDRYGMATETFQSANPLFIILLAPLFARMWTRLHESGRSISIPAKFGLAIIQVGLGFGIVTWGARLAGPDALVPGFIVVLMYLVHTTGELCISPVGLSAMTKLAPPRLAGLIMGAWFLSWGYANYAAGQISALTGTSDAGDSTASLPAPERLQIYTDVFSHVFVIAAVIGVVFLLLSPLINRLLHGIK